MTFEKSEIDSRRFLNDRNLHHGSSVCYSAFPGRGGFKSASDMRLSHRRDIAGSRIRTDDLLITNQRTLSRERLLP